MTKPAAIIGAVLMFAMQYGSLSLAQEWPTLKGAASCATSTCHGNQSPDASIWSRSLSLHLAHDPHAGAGIVLQERLSQQIVARLDPQAVQSRAAYDNLLRERCLACHVTVEPAECEPIGKIPDEMIGQGVSCESCHGPASVWLDAHVQTDWDRLRDDSMTAFRDNDGLVGRAQTCVRCHVGSRTEDGLVRDVNHDLIAAGHPALRFDLLSYNANLPAHWDTDSKQEKEWTSSHVRVRETGQAVGLSAAARLSAERASDYLSRESETKVVWPELADFDCFACHQSLSTDSYHLPPDDVTRSDLHVSDGIPVWNAWHSILLLDLRNRPDYLAALSPQQVAPKKMAIAGLEIAERYMDEANRLAREAPNPKRVLDAAYDKLKVDPPVDWHAAAVQFLRIEAAADDLIRSGKHPLLAKSLEEKLPQLEQMLRFRGIEKDGQTESNPMSPMGFQPKRFQAVALEAVGFSLDEKTQTNSETP